MSRVVEPLSHAASAACALGLVLGCGSTSQISLLGGGARSGDGGASGVGVADASTVQASAGGTRITAGLDPGDASSGCQTNAECTGATPFCDTAQHACVACLVDSNCSTYLCDTTLHTCVTCVRSSDCHEPTRYCDDDDRRCVQCISAAQCPLGQVCVAEAHACAAPCTTSADCAGGGRPLCAAAAGVCVECVSNADCVSGDHPEFCDLKVGSCVECLQDSDCGQGRCTPLERRCVACFTSADCSDGKRCVSSECVQ